MITTIEVDNWEDFQKAIKENKFVIAPWKEDSKLEEKLNKTPRPPCAATSLIKKKASTPAFFLKNLVLKKLYLPKIIKKCINNLYEKGILFLISVFTFLFASSPILAAESFTQLGNPNIFAAEQLTLDEPKYLQDTIIMSGQTDLDSIFVKDAIVMSGQTNISPETIITEDLIILSGQQTISGRVKKDVIVIGGEITIDSDAIIDGYLLALGGQVTLAGTVKDSVHIFAGQADIKDTAVIKRRS